MRPGPSGSLLAAGTGMYLAASGIGRCYIGRFLSACTVVLATMYGVLLFLAGR